MPKLYAAEDSPVQALYLRRILEKDPRLEVTFFDDGLELYFGVMQHPPDLVILDIILPNLSGMAALRLLKFDPTHRRLPIMVVSSITEDDLEERLHRLRVDAFVPKPFKPEQLMGQVRDLLELDPLPA